MVYIPLAGVTPLEPDPVFQLSPQLDALRRATNLFIATDPTIVVFVPQNQVSAPSGGKNLQIQPPRPSQRVKLVRPATDGKARAEANTTVRHEYVIVASWNATVKVNDFWEGPEDLFWIVKGLAPYNGYEVKAFATSYGGPPQHG